MSNSDSRNFGSDTGKNAVEARSDAQRIAFAPMVFQATKALRDLGILQLLFDARKRGLTASEISSGAELPIYGVKILLEAGLGAEVVFLEDDRFYLSKTGYFILRDRMTEVNMNFVSDVCYQGMASLQDSLLAGKPVGLEGFGSWSTIYEGLSQLPEETKKSWFEFDHFYSDTAFPEVLALVFQEAPRHLVDVGGNTGKWASKCLEYDEDVHVTVLDLPGQIAQVRKNLEDSGFGNRFSTMEVNLLQEGNEFPSDVDVVWMSQFLDCFSEEEIVTILRRAKSGMHQGSSLFILETFWDRQKFEASAFCLVNTSLYFACLANGNSKMYHSDEMKGFAETAGLALVNQTDDIGIGHTLLEYKLPAIS